MTISDKSINNRTLSDSEILNRFGYHRATEVTIPRHNASRAKFLEMCQFLDTILPEGRSKTEALKHLDESAMWANKAIAEIAPVVQE